MEPEQLWAVEEEIAQRLAMGELQEAAETAIRQYGPDLLGYLVRVTDSEDDASEIFAQFCEDLWRGLPGFEGRCRFRTWMYYLATNARSRFWKDPYRRQARHLATDRLSKIQHDVRSSTLRFLRTEVKDRFREIQRQLDPRDRELLILRVDRGLSWNEIVLILSKEERPPSEEEIRARATKLRQRFSRLGKKLHDLCEAQGLLEP